MRRRRWIEGGLVLLTMVFGGAVGNAAEPYTYTVSALAGMGGTFDADPAIGFDHSLVQFNLGFVTSPRTHVIGRLGRLDLDDDRGLEGLHGAELTYLTIAGEYRYLESLYDSGVFLGLGGYRLEGSTGSTGGDETALGLSFGVTGDFRLTQSWSVAAELVAHWADLDRVQIFASGQIGVAYHF